MTDRLGDSQVLLAPLTLSGDIVSLSPQQQSRGHKASFKPNKSEFSKRLLGISVVDINESHSSPKKKEEQ